MTETNRPLPDRDVNRSARPLALVTGASSGIGLELAWECVRNGFMPETMVARQHARTTAPGSGIEVSHERHPPTIRRVS